MQEDAIQKGASVIIVDDLIGTQTLPFLYPLLTHD